jgi:hypothetical protein
MAIEKLMRRLVAHGRAALGARPHYGSALRSLALLQCTSFVMEFAVCPAKDYFKYLQN